MMADQPARITPGEISALLDRASGLTSQSPLADQIAFGERKALLLSLLADRLNTPEAHRAAADAWHLVRSLVTQLGRAEVTP
jgi:hypothetical protein